MNIQLINKLKKPNLSVIVTDRLFRKSYFHDSEVIGWLLIEENETVNLYHLFQRGWDENGKEISEFVYFIDEKLVGDKEKENCLYEAEFQLNTKENLIIFEQVKTALKTNKIAS